MTPLNFPWRPGMVAVLDTGGARGQVLWVRPDGRLDVWLMTPAQRWTRVVWSIDTCHPDRTDPATLGALLGVVREVHNAPHAYLWPNRGASEWAVYRETTFSQREPLGEGETEFDALLAACKAAP